MRAGTAGRCTGVVTTLLPPPGRPTTPPTTVASDVATPVEVRRSGWREVGLLVLVYAGYSLSRVFADDAFAPARERAMRIVDLERPLGLAFEAPLNRWFAESDLLGLIGAFQYATAHYVVTLAVVGWLFWCRPALYLAARRALVIATGAALVLYLLAPTAPPRLVDGFTDVLAQHGDAGWWEGAASAPQGMGWMTNQLAAFPSMHAGWALWVALVVAASTPRLLPRLLAWAHALLTAIVVVGTGNHWTLDVVVGWLLVAFVWLILRPADPSTQTNDR